MKYLIHVTDKDTKEYSEHLITARKGTKMTTFVLKGVEKHVEKYAQDPLNYMSEIKSLHREAYDLEDFVTWLEQDLDLSIHITDSNNHRFYNSHRDEYTTSYELGRESYEMAWRGQYHEEDGEKDFEKYIADFDTVVQHGNELASEEWFSENWELEE